MFSQADIDQLKAAIASGALSVRYADNRQVQYRSLAEMREILRMMQDEVRAGTSAQPVSRSFLAEF